jgi:hypothetical protein
MQAPIPLFLILLLAATAPVRAADDEPKVTGTGRAVYVDGELLKDYDPKPPW